MSKDASSILRKNYLAYYLFKKLDKFELPLNYGWYFLIKNSSLLSDSPQNCRNNSINYKVGDEFNININMQNGTYNLYPNDNDNKIVLYNKIPLDKPITLSVLLYDEEDSIEIIPF